MRKQPNCGACSGSGVVMTDVKCDKCGPGWGGQWCSRCSNSGVMDEREDECEACNGEGGGKCWNCGESIPVGADVTDEGDDQLCTECMTCRICGKIDEQACLKCHSCELHCTCARGEEQE